MRLIRLFIFPVRLGLVVLLVLAPRAARAEVLLPSRPHIPHLYGFVQPRIIYASRPAATFGHRNLQAPTMAFPLLMGDPAGSGRRATWSVAQTRLGLDWRLGEPLGTALEAKLEFDFFDATLSAPSVVSKPRLRIAALRWHLDAHQALLLGQDFDLFAPMAPFTYNIVGGYFQAGNVAFMRHQLRYEYHQADLELGLSLGEAGSSSGTTDTDGVLEHGALPLLAARAIWTPAAGRHRLGVSGLLGARSYLAGARVTRTMVYAGNLFFEVQPDAMFVLRGEGTYGRNLNDLGALALSTRTGVDDVEEASGFISFKLKPGIVALFGGAGASFILHPGRLPGLAVARATTALIGSVAHNLTGKLGLSVDLGLGLTAFAEYAYFHTKVAEGAGRYHHTDASVPEVGLHWAFGA